jgi:hypothetical protein
MPSNPTSLTWSEVTTRRVERHSLAEPATGITPADIARTMCGVHAQIMSAAEISIGRRLIGVTRSDVRRAIWEERTLVKTFGPRGTVHLLPTADLPMWTGALLALPPSVPNHPEPIRFTSDELDEVVAAIGDALSSTELTIDELTAAIEDRTGPWAVERTMDAFQDKWPRWRQVTSTAAHRGVLCFGPNRGRKITYASPQRWLPGFRPQHSDPALGGLLNRYLHAYGPATPEDFAQWLNIPRSAATGLFDRHRDMLEPVTLDGETAWVVAGDTATPDQPHRGIRLLPYFDAYVVACRPRRLLYPGPAAARALSPTGQAGNFPVMLVDGVVGGVWHQKRSGRKVAITVEPLGDLTAGRRRELDREIELVGTVMEAEPNLTIGKVNVGPHA